jgi:CheY-like chemotaxis protein
LPAEGLAGRRVLVLDDDERVQQSTAGLLRSWGCEVVLARSAAEAIERLGSGAPSLLIADLHLGDGELGSDAVVQLRERFDQPIAAVLVSGDIGSDARERARAAGLYLLDKPVRPMALRALAARLMAEVDWAVAPSSPSS